MALFSHIPDRLFSVLSSAKKEIYADALFVLYELFQGQLAISRDEVESALIDRLGDRLVSADFSDEEEDVEDSGISAKVQIILRRLKETKWIDYEAQRDSFRENVTLPDYAVAIIRTLRELESEKRREYNGYVFSTYSVLRTSFENPDYRYRALVEAYNQTSAFIEALKTLFGNIKEYISRIAGMASVNDLLHEHFDIYVVEVAKAVIEPIRTIDSVPRFKHRILEMLRQMEDDEEIFSSLTKQALLSGGPTDEVEAEDDVRSRIHYIMDIYSTVESTIAEIDTKHSSYISSSVQRMRYMMSADRGSRGNLITILRSCAETGELVEGMDDAIDLTSLELLDGDSFFNRIERRVRDDGTSQPVARHSEDEDEVESLFEELKSQYSSDRIDAYIMEQLDERNADTIDSAELRMDGIEDFILFLLATIRGGEESAPFTCTFAEGEERRGSAIISGCTFHRRKDVRK